MNHIKSQFEDDVLTIVLSGRIDAMNAKEVEDEIIKLRDQYSESEIIIDVKNLDYISSAGLRVILRLYKAHPKMKIIDVSTEVYEIFNMTGFTDMMPIQKAYRVMSVEGCEMIGQGANSKVYRFDPETIIKVYYDADALSEIHRERELSRKAFVLGIPTAIPYDVVRVNEGFGAVFELLNAESLSECIAKEPENLDKYVEISTDLLKKIHSTEIKSGDIPNMRDSAMEWADFLKDYLPVEQSEKLIRLFETVPEDYHMLHGDYHVKNVMMQDGEALLIDLDSLCMGSPIFEFAKMFISYIGFDEADPQNTKVFFGISAETTHMIWNKTLRLYFNTDDEKTLNDIAEKSMIIGYANLLRRVIRRNGFNTSHGQTRIELCKQHFAELLPKIDSLVI